MSNSDRIPRDKKNDHSREMASQRAAFIEAIAGTKLDTVSSYTIDPAVTQRQYRKLHRHRAGADRNRRPADDGRRACKR